MNQEQEPVQQEDTAPDSEDSKGTSKILERYIGSKNIVEELSDEKKAEIVQKVLSGIDDDKISQQKWMIDVDESLKLARLEREPKNTPFENAANIKYPLIATASMQFAARTYPELIQDGKIVKAMIAGVSNPLVDKLAEGVTIHMSHQLLGADSSWEAGMDTLLSVLPNVGFVVKKTYYDSIDKKNCSDVCYYKDVILRNDPCIQKLDDLRRITHVLHIHPNELISNARAGIYDKQAVMEILESYATNQNNRECDLYEQHRFEDLDDDTYEEPYIVTVHKQTNKLLRIIPRYQKEDIEYNEDNEVQKITPIQYFTAYHFLPAPDGSFMSVGFGCLLLHLNETVNTILNELIDAGQLCNLQTGFMDSRIKIMGGQTGVNPGEWIKVKSAIGTQLKDGLIPVNYKEPSSVLYQLLGLLLDASKQLTSSTDAMQGLQNATNVPATSMLAMIEQGMKMFSAIQRRLYRALKEDFQKLYKLNGRHLDEEDYIAVLGPEYAHLPNIYKTKAVKVIPIADPNLASDAQRLAQAQVIMGIATQPGSLVSQYQAQRRMLEAAKVPNIDQLLPKQLENAPKPPDPKMTDVQNKHQTKSAEVQIKAQAQSLKEKEFVAKLSKMDADITNTQSSSLKNVAEAHAIGHQTQSEDFQNQLEAVKTKIQAAAQAHQQLTQSVQQHNQLKAQTQQAQQDHQREMIGLQQNQQDLDQTHQREVTGLQQNQDQIDANAQQPDTGQSAGQDNQGYGQ